MTLKYNVVDVNAAAAAADDDDDDDDVADEAAEAGSLELGDDKLTASTQYHHDAARSNTPATHQPLALQLVPR